MGTLNTTRYFTFLFFSSLLLSSSIYRSFYPQRSSGQAVVTGVVPSPPPYVPSFLSHIGFSIPTARQFSLNFAQMLPVYFVLRLYSEYRVHFTEGLNTASTGSMSSKSNASSEVSAVSNPEMLKYGREYPQYRTPKYCEYAQYILPKYCRYS